MGSGVFLSLLWLCFSGSFFQGHAREIGTGLPQSSSRLLLQEAAPTSLCPLPLTQCFTSPYQPQYFCCDSSKNLECSGLPDFQCKNFVTNEIVPASLVPDVGQPPVSSADPVSSGAGCDVKSPAPNPCYNANGDTFICCPGSCPTNPGSVAACGSENTGVPNSTQEPTTVPTPTVSTPIPSETPISSESPVSSETPPVSTEPPKMITYFSEWIHLAPEQAGPVANCAQTPTVYTQTCPGSAHLITLTLTTGCYSYSCNPYWKDSTGPVWQYQGTCSDGTVLDIAPGSATFPGTGTGLLSSWTGVNTHTLTAGTDWSGSSVYGMAGNWVDGMLGFGGVGGSPYNLSCPTGQLVNGYSAWARSSQDTGCLAGGVLFSCI